MGGVDTGSRLTPKLSAMDRPPARARPTDTREDRGPVMMTTSSGVSGLLATSWSTSAFHRISTQNLRGPPLPAPEHLR